MRSLARLLLLIPLGLLLAFSAGGFFLMLATVVSPALAGMVFSAMNAFAEVVLGLAFNGEDPSELAIAASWQGFKLAASILIAPLLITAVASEAFKLPGAMLQMVMTGLLAAALPSAVIGLRRLPTGPETEVLAAFFLTGVITGAVYWLIAGRGAGEGRREQRPATRPVSGPPA